MKPSLSDTDAVTEPERILFVSNASGANAVLGMLNKFLPLPLKAEPLCSSILPYANILPLTLILPVKVEPRSGDTTTNPKLGDTDAVTEPDVILGDSTDGTFFNLLPSPSKEPLKLIPTKFIAVTEPVTSTLPVNSEPNN